MIPIKYNFGMLFWRFILNVYSIYINTETQKLSKNIIIYMDFPKIIHKTDKNKSCIWTKIKISAYLPITLSDTPQWYISRLHLYKNLAQFHSQCLFTVKLREVFVFKLTFWKEDEMLRHDKQDPVPTILRPASGITFEMSSFCA